MRTISFLILFVFVTVESTKAQPSLFPELQDILTARKNNLTLPEFLNILKLDGQQYIQYNTIDNVEILYIKKQEFIRKIAFRTDWFHFAFVTDHSHNILVSSIALLGEKSSEEKRFEQIHNDFSHYVEKHQNFYDVSIDLYDSDMTPFNNYVFGTGCGLNNTIPLKCEKMFTLVRQNNTKQLYQWVCSMNPTIQAYGVLGLYLLEKKGKKVKLKKKEKQIINYVKNKAIDLDYCSSVYLEPTIPMNEVLSDSYLETIWYMFKDSVYLR